MILPLESFKIGAPLDLPPANLYKVAMCQILTSYFKYPRVNQPIMRKKCELEIFGSISVKTDHFKKKCCSDEGE